MSRENRLKFNTISGLLLQITTIVCGFILPRAILNIYGSDVNGLVNSIAQFLQIIAFLELGVGAVVQSSMYKPIAEHDYEKISELVAASNGFFRKIAVALLLYVILLTVVFPQTVGSSFEGVYSIVLIIAMSISYFAQYYFGMTDRLFLNAIQKNYITNFINIITLISNTVGCYVLVYSGFSIQVVKIVTSLVFLIRPIVIRIYINKNYVINRDAKYTNKSISQKWNGIAQHIAAIVLDSTDTVVLSLFSTLSNVSIYAVYNIVASGIRQLLSSTTGGVMSVMGEFWVKDNKIELERFINKSEFFLHTLTLFFWGCTVRLIIPFVMIYTKGVSDTNYFVPTFSILICAANAVCGLRLNFNYMILAANQYKETQHIFIFAAIINLIVSIFTVKVFGLVGVAIGTLCATTYQTFHMQWYCIKILKVYSYRKVVKQLLIDIVGVGIFYFFSSLISFECSSWIQWILLSMKIACVNLLTLLLVNGVFFKNEVLELYKKMTRRRS